MTHRYCWLIAATVAILRLGVARADPAAEGVASALFEQARQDMRRGQYAAACPKLAESHRLDPSNGTLLNLVVCEEKLGKVASAWVHGRELADRLPPADDRRPIVQRKLAALEPRLPRLTIRLATSAPEGTRVILDGVELGASSLGIALPVDPGGHRIVVTASGRKNRTSDIEIEEAKQLEWSAEPGEEIRHATAEEHAAKQPTAVPSARDEKPKTHRSPERRPQSPPQQQPPKWLGWTSLGIGAAGLVAGTILGAMTLDRKATVDDNCNDGLCRDQSGVDAAREGKVLVVGTAISFAVAAGGLGFGVYFLTREDRVAARLQPAAPSVAVATWRGAF